MGIGTNMPVGMRLTTADTNLLQAINNDAVLQGSPGKAGHGYMGLMVNAEGNPFTVKFLTKWTERGLKTDSSIMKDVSANENGAKAFASSNRLADKLIELADKVGRGNEVRGLIAEYQKHADYNQQSLLSRKVVFNVVQTIRRAAMIDSKLKGRGVGMDILRNSSVGSERGVSPKSSNTSLKAVFEGLNERSGAGFKSKDVGGIPSKSYSALQARILATLRMPDIGIAMTSDIETRLFNMRQTHDLDMALKDVSDAIGRALDKAKGDEKEFRSQLETELFDNPDANTADSTRAFKNAKKFLVSDLVHCVRYASQTTSAHAEIDDDKSARSELTQRRTIKAAIGRGLQKLGIATDGNEALLTDVLVDLKLMKLKKQGDAPFVRREVEEGLEVINDKLNQGWRNVDTLDVIKDLLNAPKLNRALGFGVKQRG